MRKSTECVAAASPAAGARALAAWMVFAWALVGALVLIGGCRQQTVDPVADQAARQDDDHDHDHHHHEHGPRGGHMVHLQPGDRHAEWVHLDEEDIVQVFLEAGVQADAVAMVVEVSGEEPRRFEFQPAADPELGEGAFELQSPELLTAVTIGEGVEVTLEVLTAEGAVLTADVEHHEH